MRKLRDERIELMQIHNLLDWRTHLDTLRAWKRDGRIQYLASRTIATTRMTNWRP